MQNPGNHIIDHLIRHALADPDTTAFIILDGDGNEIRITYKELLIRVKKLSFHLSDEAPYGARVLLLYQDIPDFICSFLACQHAGLIAVPVPYVTGSKQWQRLLAIMQDADASAILTTGPTVPDLRHALDGLAQPSVVKIVPTDSTVIQGDHSWESKAVTHEISFIQYTSGSTGKPKGVVITAANLMHNQQMIAQTFGCDKTSVIFSWLPFHHDMGLIGNILHAVYTGCTCILMSPLHFIQAPLKWLKAISTYKVTHSGGPNFAYDLCVERITPAELAGVDLSTWRVAYNGAEPVRHTTLSNFARHFSAAGFDPGSFYPCYGLAEATLLVSGIRTPAAPAFLPVDSHIAVACGSAAAGMEIMIISPDSRLECGEMEEGEICIGGESITPGYWNKDNSGSFYEFDGRRYLRTGDLGFLYKGALYIQGRITEMLIVRGRNVHPYDIERSIAESHPALETNGVAVFRISHFSEHLVVAAEIRRSFLRTSDTAAILDVMNKTLSGSFGIGAFDILLLPPLGIPRTTSGKIQRGKCRELYRDGSFKVIAKQSGRQQDETAGETQLLEKLLEDVNYVTIGNYLSGVIGTRVGKLTRDELNGATELTQLGIDSLKATELINIINRDLHINIDVTRVFRDNSISGLINTIESLLWLKNTQTSGEEITI